MLDAVGQLGEHFVGDVARGLRDEVNAYAFRANELDHLDHLVEQFLRHAVEQQVRFVEEKHELRLVHVSYFWQRFEQLGEHPQEEHRVDLRALNELCGIQHVYVALAAFIAREPVRQIERRFAEEFVPAFILDRDERTQDGAGRLRGDFAVRCLELFRMLGGVVEHGAQIFQVDKQKLLVVGNAENNVEHAFLHFCQAEQAGEQGGAHVGDGDAHGDVFAVQHVPETARAAGQRPVFDAEPLDALADVVSVVARLAHAGDIAFDVRHEHGHTCVGEPFREDFERDGLSRAGRAGDKTMAVCLVQQQVAGILSLGDPEFVIKQHGSSLKGAWRPRGFCSGGLYVLGDETPCRGPIGAKESLLLNGRLNQARAPESPCGMAEDSAVGRSRRDVVRDARTRGDEGLWMQGSGAGRAAAF